MENTANEILAKLAKQSKITSKDFTGNIFPTLQMLQSHNLIAYKAIDEKHYVLTKEAKDIVKNGSPEYILYKKIKNNENYAEETKIAQGYAFKNGWIEVKYDKFVIKNEDAQDELQKILVKFDTTKAIDKKDMAMLKKRKLIDEIKQTYYEINKGSKYEQQLPSYATEITAQMICNQEYKNLVFKPYNFDTTGVCLSKGNLHPLLKVKEEFRNIFLSLGFTEMKSDNFVESSFWNFDVLFQPQQHPSRDAHDTFFVNEDVNLDTNKQYLEKVKNVHENGGYRSQGYMSEWCLKEAKKGVLRTHTTAISARYLYKIAQMMKDEKAININKRDTTNLVNIADANTYSYNETIKIDKNNCYKLFSIDKVFRNESLDATHLPEFHQIEGVIVGKNLHLGQLMGIIHTFFIELGMKDVKFKPAYNPYTEPSMEIFAFHPQLNKWIEIGNSGIFRPEMLKPMGFDDDIRVFGWGLSVERPTMIMYGIKDIRELVGHKVSYEFIRNSKICMFE
ncbi:Phenylalanyl-tRNA synthetase [Binucleata daphniae]